jgi:hypothetical protein
VCVCPCCLAWQGGPVDGLGWSSYYLRTRSRVDVEPLVTGDAGAGYLLPSSAASPEARRPRTAPVSAMRATALGDDGGGSLGLSKGSTPGLGINNAGYHSTQAVTADLERRQLHFGDDSSHPRTRVADPRTPGRTMERDPWVGDGFEQQVVTQTTVVNTPMVQHNLGAEQMASQVPPNAALKP